MNEFFTAFDQILNSDLTPSTSFFALRLLRAADDAGGNICLDWNTALTVAGISNRGSVRRHLIALQKANIIHYATNGDVYLSFLAYSARGFPRAEAPEPARGFSRVNEIRAHARGFPRSEAPESARMRADSPPTPPNVCLYVDDLDQNLETNKHVEQPSTDEQTRSIELLTDSEIGISESVAETLASQHRFEWLERHTFAYLSDLNQGKVSGPGALVNRLKNRWSPGQLTEDDKASDLYARHHDLAEERRNAYVPEEYAGVIIH